MHVLSQYGKIWAIIVIIFGVGGFASIIYELGNELIQLKNYRSRTMRNKISKLEQHYIICGYGRMGAVIATELHKKHIPFVIIDINDTKIGSLKFLGWKLRSKLKRFEEYYQTQIYEMPANYTQHLSV